VPAEHIISSLVTLVLSLTLLLITPFSHHFPQSVCIKAITIMSIATLAMAVIFADLDRSTMTQPSPLVPQTPHTPTWFLHQNLSHCPMSRMVTPLQRRLVKASSSRGSGWHRPPINQRPGPRGGLVGHRVCWSCWTVVHCCVLHSFMYYKCCAVCNE
jgi:hypothetical protein